MNRRKMIEALAAAGFGASELASAYAKGNFWDNQQPNEWSPQQRSELITDSPWAKQVRADTSRAQAATPPIPDSGKPIPMRMPGSVSIDGTRGRGRHQGNLPIFQGIVRWESAKPVLAALKKTLPAELVDHYVIGVSGFPFGLHNSQSDKAADTGLDDLKQITTLRAKGKDPAQAGVVLRSSDSDGPVMLFGFSRDVIEVRLSDKNVEFETQLGPLDIRAKFELKPMQYHGELAL
ncbi:MAG TPA: hypothetical protein VN633_11505 [Bryobacteraceae bacterium]|nr:hypothetical protein [Bryobacteraceae bacterium]